MFYKKYLPDPDLSFYVECYYVWENEHDTEVPLEVESPPPAFTSIVFNYADDYYVSSNWQKKQKVPRQFIAGQQRHSYRLHFPGKIGTAAIVFKPTGIASLFKLPMYAFTEERIDLKAVLQQEEVNIIAEEISSYSDADSKAAALETFVMQYFLQNEPVPDAIDIGANKIVEKNGEVNIHELCNEVYISRRQFERKFLEKVGLSPKYYARLRRIGYICSQMAGKEQVNWQDLYYECDYYDQSHFIKDFTEFTGRSPTMYFNTNIELVHHLKK